MTTWTPRALGSNTFAFASDLWRVVEAQHVASTMRLVDGLADQAVLESVLEASKPTLPAGTEKLHYLLSTPFRYRPRMGSRFRAAFEAGVWYGAEELRTSLAEKSYWRLKFLLDSPRTPDLKPVPHTAFSATVRGTAIDLTVRPFVRDRATWTHRTSGLSTLKRDQIAERGARLTRRDDRAYREYSREEQRRQPGCPAREVVLLQRGQATSYDATQALAATARDQQVEIIRYESVRDPEHAACAAVLTPAAFHRPTPRAEEAWFIAASRERVRCARDLRVGHTWEFSREQLLGV